MMLSTVYALAEPESDDVRYVGRTSNNPLQRYSEHLLGLGNATKEWIRELRGTHKVPTLKILEEDVPVESAGKRERYWIDYWRSNGAPLLNYTCKPPPSDPPLLIIPGPAGSLIALLQTKGIHRPADLVQRVPGLTRQMAGLLWHGDRQISRPMARRLENALGIPYADLMLAESVKPRNPPPKGRPRKKRS